jgi:hypothetical protein
MTGIEATFKHEDQAEGEPVGPVILSDPDDAEFHEELEPMPLSVAKKLAEMNRWTFSEDQSR